MMFAVARLERLIGILVGKQGLHTLHFKFHCDLGGKFFHHFLQGKGHFLFGI